MIVLNTGQRVSILLSPCNADFFDLTSKGEVAMRLELDILNIKDVQFAEKTSLSGGVLSINRRELQGLLQEDRRLSRVEIELAHPGDKCRILQVADVSVRARTTSLF